MNNPSPLIPQGSMFEQKINNRARVRMAVFLILTVHVVGLMALLMQGCRKPAEPEPGPMASFDTNDFPMFDVTNTPEVFLPETNVTAYVPPMPAPETNFITPTAPAFGVQEYTVARGDTFYDIARKFGITTRQIQDANPSVEPTRLQPGQKIIIPAPTAPATRPDAATAPADNGQMYTVKSGDTLTSIARQYGVTVRALRAENDLTTDRIRVGQRLRIPASATAPGAPIGQ